MRPSGLGPIDKVNKHVKLNVRDAFLSVKPAANISAQFGDRAPNGKDDKTGLALNVLNGRDRKFPQLDKL